ncbi:MAG: hypothetical protein ACE5F9_00150 [Phycisphaerae bacterium]
MASSDGSTRIPVKLGLAACGAVAAIGISVYVGLFRDKPTVDTSATVLLHCSKCGEQFEMPWNKYHTLAPKGTDISGGLTCSKCGAESAASRINRPSSRVLTPNDYDLWKKESLTLDDLRREKSGEEAEDEEEYEPEPKKEPPKFSPS